MLRLCKALNIQPITDWSWVGAVPMVSLSVASLRSLDSHRSHSLNSLKGGYMGDYIGDYYRGY